MGDFLFFPAGSLTQESEESFKLTTIYGGIFNLKFPSIVVYLSQIEERNKRGDLNKLGISGEKYEFILNQLIRKRIIYITNRRKEIPFNKRKVLDQILENPFTHQRALNIGDITLELTDECPHSCEGCFRETSQSTPTTLQRLENIINELSTMGLKKLSLSGGEITSSEEAFEKFKHISKYAKNKGIEKIRLLTTGFNPERVTESLKYLDEVQISIDGLRKTHDEYKKREGTFNKTIESLKICEKEKVRLTTNTVVNQRNYKEIPVLIDFLSQFQIDTMRITKIMSNRRDLRLNTKDAKELYKRVKEKQEKYPEQHIINAYGNCTDILNCTGGIVYAHIGVTGNVFACDYDIQNIAGNINNSSFQEIWTNSLVIKEYRKIRPVNNNCQDCQTRVFCYGNCRIERDYITNTGMCKNASN